MPFEEEEHFLVHEDYVEGIAQVQSKKKSTSIIMLDIMRINLSIF